MKERQNKHLVVIVLALTLITCFLLTACSSEQETETTASIDVTATITTEATTEVTTSTTTIETTEADKSEDFANVCFTKDNGQTVKKVKAFASDFSFGEAALFKDNNGVLIYPNYLAGKDIVVSYKSKKQFVGADIYRTPYPGTEFSSKKTYIVEYNESELPEKNSISKYLSEKDGIYTLTIPAKFVKQNYQFNVELTTADYMKLTFSVCCVRNTDLSTPPKFSVEEHAIVVGNCAKNIKFVNASFPVSHDKNGYHPELPQFPEGKDIKIKFKCKDKLKLDYLYSPNDTRFEFNYSKALTYSKGIYTLTIPAKYAVGKREFCAMFTGKNALSFSFKVGKS